MKCRDIDEELDDRQYHAKDIYHNYRAEDP